MSMERSHIRHDQGQIIATGQLMHGRCQRGRHLGKVGGQLLSRHRQEVTIGRSNRNGAPSATRNDSTLLRLPRAERRSAAMVWGMPLPSVPGKTVRGSHRMAAKTADVTT